MWIDYSTEDVAKYAKKHNWDVINISESELHIQYEQYEIKLIEDSQSSGWVLSATDDAWTMDNRAMQRMVRTNSALSSVSRLAKGIILNPEAVISQEF